MLSMAACVSQINSFHHISTKATTCDKPTTVRVTKKKNINKQKKQSLLLHCAFRRVTLIIPTNALR